MKVRARLAAVVLVTASTVGMQPAHALNEGTITFMGTWGFAPAVPLVGAAASFLGMVAAPCLDVGVHPLEPKAIVDAGNCAMAFGGPYVGGCVLGSMAGAGAYTDSAGQVHGLVVSVVVTGHVWTLTGRITKGPLAGPITGGGRWVPTPGVVGCVGAISDGYLNYTI